MRTNAMQNHGALAAGQRPRRPRPDHPEDFGRGPWWRLAELFFLGFIFPSPPPVTRWFEDDDEPEA
jgi:hypothetical protein